MTSSTITTHNPSEDLKAIRNLGQRTHIVYLNRFFLKLIRFFIIFSETQVNGGSTSKATKYAFSVS